MKKKILMALLCLFCGHSYAQSGGLIINNTTNCDVTVVMHATDLGTSGSGCDFLGNTVTILAGAIAGFNTYCNFQSSPGFNSPPAPLSCSPFDPNFIWTNAVVTIGTCYSGLGYSTHYTTSAHSSITLDDVAGTCPMSGITGPAVISCCTSLTPPTNPTANFYLQPTGTSAPYTVIVDIY